MAFITIAPPPGIYRNGTIYQSKGRWYDANLMRFQQGEVKPVGGWQLRSAASAFAGACRAVLSWRDNSNNRWIGIGTHSNLYVQDEAGANHDITPAGFTAGRADATQNLGYGGGTYGTGYYGVPSTNVGSILPATVWSLDAWGEHMAGCSDSDGKLYEWSLNPASVAVVITNAPTGCAGLVVTQDGFLMALGASGDGRRVAWCDQQNNTVWTPSATNQAGDYDLPTVGTLQCGKSIPGGALLFTDVDVWRAAYIGTPLVYGFEKVGSGCGPISKGAVAAHDSVAVWMSRGPQFWAFDGQAVQPLDCDVADYLADMNINQVSKVNAVQLAQQGEVWWHYPSGSSNECDLYVCWAYRESQRVGKNIWTIGTLGRSAGTGKGVMTNPLMVDASGLLYEHETGLNYSGAVPYIETGPIEVGQGDNMAEIQGIIPDELADGDVTATLYCRNYPNSAETTNGPYLLASPTDLLVQAREARIRYTGAASKDWRIGNMRLDVVKGDVI